MMNQQEAQRCERWRVMLQAEFPTLMFHFWKDQNGGYLVQVRRTMQGHHYKAGEPLFAETFPTLVIGQWPPPEFIAKCAIMA
jgi:hypothetical protein